MINFRKDYFDFFEENTIIPSTRRVFLYLLLSACDTLRGPDDDDGDNGNGDTEETTDNDDESNGDIDVIDDDWYTNRLRMERNATVTSIASPDEDTGWAVVRDRQVLRTEDDGETWEDQEVDGVFFVDFYDISMLDRNTGYIAGSNGTILTTDNGGDTWEELETDIDIDLRTIELLDANTGYAAGEDGTVLTTSDSDEGIRV